MLRRISRSGLYRAHQFTSTSVMYTDRIKVGTTFASVAIS